MKLWHRYGGWFLFVTIIKCNYLHLNRLTTREILWLNFLTNYLKPFWITTCAFSVKSFVWIHKYVMSYTWTMILSKYVNMWQMKIQNVNSWNVIFWMKFQNSAWFQYKTFPGYNFSFLTSFCIHAWGTCFSILRQYVVLQIKRAYISVVMKSNEWNIHIIIIINFC